MPQFFFCHQIPLQLNYIRHLFPKSYIIFRTICVIYFVTLPRKLYFVSSTSNCFELPYKKGRETRFRPQISCESKRKKSGAAILITSLNPIPFRPLCRREIKQLSRFALVKLFDRSRIALFSISVSRVVVKPPSSPSPFSLVTVGQGQDGMEGMR